MLPEAALETLRQFKQRMTATPRTVVWSVPTEAAAEVFEAQQSLDSRNYTNWVAERLIYVLRRNELDPMRELIEAKGWYIKILRRRYLVPEEFVSDAYARSLELAERR